MRAGARPPISALIADLASDREVTRESSISRLVVLGLPAIEALTSLIRDREAKPVARAGALRALEAIGDARPLDLILQSLDDPQPSVSEAAAGAARAFLQGPRSADVVDRLTGVAVDRQRPDDVRLAALRTLSGLDRSTLKPLYRALKSDPSPAVAALAAHPDGVPSAPAAGGQPGWIADEEQPIDANSLRAWLSQAKAKAPLAVLHKLVERLRQREEGEEGQERAEWTALRGAVHLALANRGSRVALYDLRESVEHASGPLPLDYLNALRETGDASCLEAIASASSRATDEWWRNQLAALFKEIAARERITKRHAVMKRIDKRWPGVFRTL